MIKKSSKYLAFGLFVACSVLSAKSVLAAEVIFQSVKSGGADGSAVVEVLIDPQSKRLNVVEGAIKFSGADLNNLSVQVENGESILPMWPNPPQYDKAAKSIRFTGGVPDGFDSEGLLFKVRLFSDEVRTFTLSYEDGAAYLNDGKGTKEPVSSKSLEITVGKDGEGSENESVANFSAKSYGIIILFILLLVVIYKYGFKKNNK